MHTPRFLVHQQKAKLALGNQDQPTAEKNLVKSMDFSHAKGYGVKWLLNRFLLPLGLAVQPF